MRSRFDEQLSELNDTLMEMAAMVESAIARATDALVRQDADLAREVLAGDDAVDDKEKEIESLCLKLLLQQHPVASDLRQVSTALKMITDMERIGDQAADICEIVLYLTDTAYAKELEHIPQMAETTIRMVHDSIHAYVQKDQDLARSVIERDDVVDALYVQIKNDLIALIHQNADNGSQAMDLLMVAKYLERIGDHAENIAEWVLFSLTGMHKNRRVL